MLIEFPLLGSFSREWLEDNPEQAQELLAQCKGRYPMCKCREPGLPLYIARRNRLYLARVPNSGPQHAPCCPSYEPDRSLCGLSIYSARALSDCAEGRVAVKLGVPLTIRGERASTPLTSTQPTAAEYRFRDSVELPGLLHLLWERAGFNRWNPRMRHRRHYRQVYKYFLEAADTIQIRRYPLTRHLYVPEPYAPDQALGRQCGLCIARSDQRAPKGHPQCADHDGRALATRDATLNPAEGLFCPQRQHGCK